MKRILAYLITTLVVGSAVMFGGVAHAYAPLGAACIGSNSTVCQQSGQTGDPITGTGGILLKVTNLLAIAAGIIAVIIIMIAGLQYVTSGGDSNKVNTAKNTILYTVVGIVVIIIARTLITFVIGKLG